jgi:hypothetical protein
MSSLGWARSSVVEHLPFKQRVGGSRPPGLTESLNPALLQDSYKGVNCCISWRLNIYYLERRRSPNAER